MMQIGLIDANDQLVEAELDSDVYHLGLSWNEEGQLWTMSVRDLNRTLLISGIAVVPFALLLRQVRRPGLPSGDFAVITTTLGMRLVRSSFVDGTAALVYASLEDLV